MGDLKQQRFRIGPADKLHPDSDVVSDRPNFALIGRVVKYALSLRVEWQAVYRILQCVTGLKSQQMPYMRKPI